MSEKLDLIVPYIFCGLKFKFGEDIYTVREICGNSARAENGKVEMKMEKRGTEWFQKK